jgi:hypothetical protein
MPDFLVASEVKQHDDVRENRPFRIHMASGEAFDVRHPEMA